jgi:hypothetical protein
MEDILKYINRKKIFIGPTSVDLVLEEEKPIKKKIKLITDDDVGFLPEEIHPYEMRWHTFRPHPHWSKKCIPIAAFFGTRSNNHRRKIMKMMRKTDRPIILLYPGASNRSDLYPPNLVSALHLRENIIIFSWPDKMSPEQRAVFYFLLTHWEEIPNNAYSYLKGLKSIPVFNLKFEINSQRSDEI